MEEIKGTKETRGFNPEEEQIEEPIPERLPEPPETQEKELEDTKKYLEIVLHELEDVRQEMKELEQRKPSGKKNGGGWKLVAGFEGILLAVLMIVGGIWYLRESFQTKETGVPTGNPAVTPETAQNEVRRTVRLTEELASKVEQLPPLPSSFSASVEQLFGYEYLCFFDGKIKVYYRNEYEEGEDMQRLGVIIDNGSRLAEFDWYYDLNGKLSLLCPFAGEFSKDGGRQLLFLEGRSSAGSFLQEGEKISAWKLEGSEELPKKLRLVDIESFWEYGSLNLLQAMEQAFSFEYTELEPGGAADAVMTVKFGEAGYDYAINKETYTNAAYNGEHPLQLEDYFTMELSGTNADFSAVAYLSEDEYLGELTGSLSVEEGNLVLSGMKYGAYVLPDQEDYGSDGIILPRTSVLTDRVTILGEKKERYLIELSDRVERNSRDFENFLEDGTGTKAYYENGEKRSVCGIDVSKYQGDIDWNKVKQAGVEYAIIRLGFRGMNEGTLEIDPYYEKNVKGAAEAGIPIGIYFFSQAVTPEEAKEEAQFVLEKIQEVPVEYPVIFDTEVIKSSTYNARANKLTRQERTVIAKAFMDEIQAAGYHPMIYANTKWMIMGLDLEQLTQYDKWYAYYGDKVTFPYEFQMLQYSDQGSIPGIKGNVDLNISFVDYSKLTP